MALSRKTQLSGCAALAVSASLIAFGPFTPQAAPTVSRDVQLASGDELIVMGGTGEPDPTKVTGYDGNEVSTVQQAINSQYGTNFTNANTDPLDTPEGTYNGTFQDDEINLLNALSTYKGDDVTVVGVSQSGGAVGLAIRDIQTGDFPSPSAYSQMYGSGDTAVSPLPSGFTAADLPQNIHWIAVAPDTMPLHDNAGGQFSYDPQNISHDIWGNVGLFPTNAANADVYCGMYDPACDFPTTGDNYAATNSEDYGGLYVHGGYTTLTNGEWNYELSHATEFTINNSSGAITIYPGDNAPTDVTHFWLMPDVHNFDTTDTAFGAAGAHYDSFVPQLESYINNVSSYEELLPVTTLEFDAGYNDALHPFEYMINGVDYTFYNNEVVPVADLPAGVALPVVSESNYYGADGYLADEIEWGLVSPTGNAASDAASSAATSFGSDFSADLAGLSHLWTELFSGI